MTVRLRQAFLIAGLAGCLALSGCASLGSSGLLGRGAVVQSAQWDPASGQMVETTQINRRRLFHYGRPNSGLSRTRLAWRLGELAGEAKANGHAVKKSVARTLFGGGQPTIDNPPANMAGPGVNTRYGSSGGGN